MPKAIKKRPKKEVEGPDVADRLSEMREKLMDRQRTLATYGIAVALLVVVIAGIFIYRYSSDQRSRKIESQAYNVYYDNRLSPQERYQKALDLFKEAYGIRKSPRVLLYIANANAELGNSDEALKTLNDFIKRFSSEKELLPLAYERMAAVYLKQGKKDEALKSYDSIAKLPGAIYKDRALFEAARILESDGKNDEAAKKYKEIAEKYKDSPYLDEAKAKAGGA